MPASTICAIIPTYNRSSYLRECLDSVLAISPPVDEIIVVNDGSTDDTERVLQDYKGRIRCLSKENGGKSSAVNVALGACTADYVWICDDDDLAVKEALVRLKAPLDADPTVDFSFGEYRAFQDEDPSRSLFNPQSSPSSQDPNIKLRLLEEMCLSLNAMLVRRSSYSKVGLFREDLIRSQDYDMVLRLSRQAKAVQVPEVIFLQRFHAGLRGSSTDHFLFESSEEKWKKYDQKIFSKIRANYSLEEFMPTFALGWEKPLGRRAALIQRAVIFVKRAMWQEAVEDFQLAGQLNSVPATPQELKLLEGAGLAYILWDILYREILIL